MSLAHIAIYLVILAIFAAPVIAVVLLGRWLFRKLRAR
jgi:hypothetical protein